ncbi:ABC transporter permease [Spongiactinospora gelatinilytica]|uniref:ABC transporter permease n=1 Tax=Spongiactinospora gelatinilytica TaxID=2666298 RepID=A0A2W2H0J5_9ACTN|nr:ABC transporter permease [Spongiactinospora gelatinilytica]PZG53902.1 ABC transporter permease [Spongiactinospora gelatinilytica]
MIWLTWRQLRGGAAMVSGALVVLAAALALTGPGLAAGYAEGITGCLRDGDCTRFFDRFFDEYQTPFLGVTVIVLVLPAVTGLFWGAPLITHELEAGTHLLVWNQTITRTRWLAVKLGITGLAAMAAAGIASLAVTWWSGPLDRSAEPGFTMMDPLVFGARGIAPVGYAAFAFILGVTVGILVRRTLPAMALTLVVFAAIQIAMPSLVRPHLMPPVRSVVELGPVNIDQFLVPDDGSPRMLLESAVPGQTGAWVLSSRLLDPAGRPIDDGTGEAALPISVASGACARQEGAGSPKGHMETCVAEINRLGYRQAATYHPFERFWAFQWIETGVYALLTLALTGLCLRWVRRRLS